MNASITYIHSKPASFMSKMIQSFMVMIGMKNYIEKKMKKKNFSQEATPIPSSLKNKFDVITTEINGRRIWTFKPKQNVSKKVILYLHGGAYILNITKYHWNLIEELLHKTNATIIVPDYPLAPSASCTNVSEFAEAIYFEMLVNIPSQNMIFMGDSAGAGIALGFAQELRNKNKTQPSQIILLSPWIDISMSNPAITEFNKKDKILGTKGLQMAGESYAGIVDTKDFRVSPIYGNFSGLGKISVFIGTHDILIADTKKLKGQLKKENIPINYFEYPKMFHAWAIITVLPESQHAINQMALVIKDEL